MLKIFCEGIGDQVFIADFIESQFPIRFERIQEAKGPRSLVIRNDEIEIVPIDGCKKINNIVIKQLFTNNTELGGKNLLIFDADFTGVNGNNGFNNCNNTIENLKKHEKYPIDFFHFLWPDNTNDGLFENLLEKIIPNEKLSVINCIESSQTCLKALSGQHQIKVPGVKEKINSYLHLFSQSTKLIDRRYNSDFWHLSPSECGELQMFKEFLSAHLNLDESSQLILS